MNIIKIKRMRDLHKARVAAYCRVSTLFYEQSESLETQRKYYTNYITAHDEWEFAGIYSDEKSGTNARNRPGFQALIQAALDGRVDHILVKSLSRFSRNMVDAQGYIKLLQSNGVHIHFEKENIDTSDPAGFMLLSFLSTIAQAESHAISESMKWSYRERFRKREYIIGNHRILGYNMAGYRLTPNKDV